MAPSSASNGRRAGACRRFEVRLTQGEHDMLADKARRLGMSRSDYVRLAIALPVGYARDAAAGSPLPLVAIDPWAIAALKAELAREGNNLNQAARALNLVGRKYASGSLRGDRAEEVASLAARALESLRAAEAAYERIAGAVEGLAAREGIALRRRR